MTTRKKLSDVEIERKLIADAANPSAWEAPITVPASRSPRPQWYGRSKRLAVGANSESLEGATVFIGTQVSVQVLFDYLEDGRPLADFLKDFPTVSRDQAVAALEQAKDLLVAQSAR